MTTPHFLLALGGLSIAFAGLTPLFGQMKVYFLKTYLVVVALLPLVAWILSSRGGVNVVVRMIPLTREVSAGVGSLTLLPVDSTITLILLKYLYLFCVGALLLRLLFQYLGTARRLSAARPSHIKDVYVHDDVTSPFSFGLWRPRIFISSDFLREEGSEKFRLALLHEQNHLRAGDPRWKILSLVARALAFFSPASWWLHARLDLEMELACDRRTILAAQVAAGVYGHFLLDALESALPNPLLSYVSETNIKRRIYAMKRKIETRRWVIFIGSILAIGASGAALAAASGASPAREQYTITAQILVDGVVMSNPRISTLSGEAASIESRSLNPESEIKLKLVANEYAKIPGGIELNIDVRYKNPAREFVARPHMVVMPGEEASVALNGDHSFELKIQAARQ